MAAEIKGITVEIGGDTSKLATALKQLNTPIKSTERELREVEKLLKLDPTNTVALTQKQDLLNQKVEETRKKLDTLRDTKTKTDKLMADGTEINQEEYRKLQREIELTAKELTKAQNEAKKFSATAEMVRGVTDNIKAGMDKVGNAFKPVSVAVTAVGAAAVKTGADFDSQMSRVEAIAGATEEELEKLRQTAEELGITSKKFSATESAEGMENLASAGFNANEIIKAMPGMLDLAASSNEDLAVSADIAASTLRGFNMDASEAGHVADVLAKNAAETNAAVSDTGEAMKYIAPLANTMELEFEEVAASIGIMADSGIKGGQAGTTLRGALSRLAKPTKAMYEVMDELGLSFYDTNGKMKSLSEMVGMLQTNMADLTKEEQQNALVTLFGQEALSGMMVLMAAGSERIDTLTNSYKNCYGAAASMAETMTDNLSGDFDEFTSKLASAGLEIYEIVEPALRKVISVAGDVVTAFTEMDDSQQKLIVTVAGVAAAVPVVTAGISGLATVVGMLTTPIGLVVAGVGAVAAGVIAAKSAFDEGVEEAREYKDELEILGTEVQELTGENEALVESVENTAEAYSDSLTDIEAEGKVLQDLADRLDDLNGKQDKTLTDKKEMAGIVDDLNSKIGDLNWSFDEETGKIKDANGAIVDNMDLLDDLIQKKMEAAQKNAALSLYEEAVKEQMQLQTAANDMEEAFEDAQVQVNKCMSNVTKAKQAWDEAWDEGYSDTFQETIDNLYMEYTAATQDLEDAIAIRNDLKTALDENAEAQEKAADSATYALEQYRNLSSGVESTEDSLKRLTDALADAPQTLDGMKSTLQNLYNEMEQSGEAGEDFMTAFRIALETGDDEVYNSIESFVNYVQSIIDGGVPKAEESAQNMSDSATEAGTAAAEAGGKTLNAAGVGMGENFGQGMVRGMWNQIPAVRAAGALLASTAEKAAKSEAIIQSPSHVWRDEIGKMLVLGMAEGITENTDVVVAAIEDMSEEALDATQIYENEKAAIEAEQDAYDEAERVKRYEESLADLEESHKEKLEACETAAEKQAEIAEYEKERLEIIAEEERRLFEKQEAERLERLKEAAEDYEENAQRITGIYAQMANDVYDDLNEVLNAITDMENKLKNYGSEGLYNHVSILNSDEETLADWYELGDMSESIAQLERYGDLLLQVKERGADKEVFETLREMDVDEGILYAEALLSATDEEFDRYMQQWQEKREAAQRIAGALYEDEGTEIANRLENVLSESADKFEEYGLRAGAEYMEGFEAAISNLGNLIKRYMSYGDAFANFYGSDSGTTTNNTSNINITQNINSTSASPSENAAALARTLNDMSIMGYMGV